MKTHNCAESASAICHWCYQEAVAEVAALKKQLKFAEDVIRFYGPKGPAHEHFQYGHRARLYFRQKEKKNGSRTSNR